MHLTTYLRLLHASERTLADAYRIVADGNVGDADVHYACARFAADCAGHADALEPSLARSPTARPSPNACSRRGCPPSALVLSACCVTCRISTSSPTWVDITQTLVGQAAHGARDRDLIAVVERCEHEVKAQLAWLRMRMKAAAPLVAD